MGLFAAGSVVIVRFPYTDLTQTKLRPAIILADARLGDWILCQITSNAFSDPLAVRIGIDDFPSGALRVTSYARPTKLFTANESLISLSVGDLVIDRFDEILDSVIHNLQSSRQP